MKVYEQNSLNWFAYEFAGGEGFIFLRGGVLRVF